MIVDLKDRVVIVTGGGGAIGRDMCIAFAQNGANVVVADLRQEAMDAVVGEIRAMGRRAIAVLTDVSNAESAANMAKKTVEEFQRVDVLVNNAGINGGPNDRKPIHEYSDDLWHRIINIDLNGVYYCSKPAISQMIAQGGGGNIINIASVVGVTPFRLQCAFAAAKAGVINLTKAMALELAPHNIRVNVIAPGSILFGGTKELFYANPAHAEAMLSHIPQKRPGSPEDIAATACYLASDDAGYVTGGLNVVDGGWICGFARDF